MNTTGFLKHWTRMLLLTLSLTQGIESAQAATYRVGDIVTNFTFAARRQFTRPDGTIVPPGGAVRLSDFAGRIVFLEWFAVWCPFCVAAAPQVDVGITDWYAARGGNPYGVPVLHVAVNQEPRSIYQADTDTFITQQGFGITVNDYGPGLGTNRVRFMLQASGQPTFAVINGVTNSPSHQPWQLLVNHLGFGDTQFSTELANFRAIIDTVQAPVVPPNSVPPVSSVLRLSSPCKPSAVVATVCKAPPTSPTGPPFAPSLGRTSPSSSATPTRLQPGASTAR
jgi:thiol-disulfide isomerase/thioredoxin